MSNYKAILKLGENFIIPITRAENVLDSKGKEAFHSYEFIASAYLPGLFTPLEKLKLLETITVSGPIPESKIVQAEWTDSDLNVIEIYPKTKAEAVIVNLNSETTTLNTIILLVLDLDEYPTQNSKKAVESGGVWLYVDDIVGEIYRVLNTI